MIALVALLVVGACGDDDTEPAAALPENDEAALIAILDPLVEPLGQHVTRVGLYDLDAGFVSDDEGDHLAIYVEPIDPAGEGWDDTRYVETLAPGMAAVTPYVFETWSGLQSMDLCQEPPQADAPEPEPPVETQVLLHRQDSDRIDWASVDLADLLGARLRSPRP